MHLHTHILYTSFLNLNKQSNKCYLLTEMPMTSKTIGKSQLFFLHKTLNFFLLALNFFVRLHLIFIVSVSIQLCAYDRDYIATLAKDLLSS